jgi:hypothetical protein
VRELPEHVQKRSGHVRERWIALPIGCPRATSLWNVHAIVVCFTKIVTWSRRNGPELARDDEERLARDPEHLPHDAEHVVDEWKAHIGIAKAAVDRDSAFAGADRTTKTERISE